MPDIGAAFVGRVDFQNAMVRLRSAAKDGLVDKKHGTLPYQAARLAEHCMKLTPPRKFEQGKSRIRKDLSWIMYDAEDGYLKFVADKFGTKHIRRQFFKKGTKNPYIIDWDSIDLTGAEIPPLHAKARDFRGRVRSNWNRNERTIGRWKAHNRVVTTRAIREAYERKMEGRVGMAKSGWVKAILAFGGAGDIEIPDWILRHSQKYGTAQFNEAGTRPSAKFSNITTWGQNHLESERIALNAMRSRTNAMTKYCEKMMKVAAEKTGGKVVEK